MGGSQKTFIFIYIVPLRPDVPCMPPVCITVCNVDDCPQPVPPSSLSCTSLTWHALL